MRGNVLAAALIFASAVPALVTTMEISKGGYVMSEFRAFYCAGRAITMHADPYRTQPLRACENLSALGAFRLAHAIVVPAPQPPFALAFFAPLARLPFAFAGTIYAALLIAACALATVLTARLCAVPPAIVAALWSFTLFEASLPLGHLAPVAIAALCAAAWFVTRDEPKAAALAAAFSLIVPHVGFAACLALFVYVPRARITLVSSAAFMTLISILAVGPGVCLEYLSSVLPAQALSEAGSDTQYSLTALLVNAGVHDTLSVRAGELFTLLMLVVGIALAGTLARRLQSPALIVFVPVAAALFGGAYVHLTEIAAALPAALLVCAPLRSRVLALTIPLLLAVPWMPSLTYAMFVAPLLPAAVYAAYVYGDNPRAITVTLACTALAMLSLLALSGVPALTHARAYSATPVPADLAQHAWQPFALQYAHLRPLALIERVPTWLGLLGVVAAAALSSRKAVWRPERVRHAALLTHVDLR